jgi:hypothetical protein
MKKIIVCLMTVLLGLASCDKACNPKHPQDLKPIDWENYNDVYTVYWNYINKCREKSYNRNEKKKIKVYGWVKQDPYGNNDFTHSCFLINEQSEIFATNMSNCTFVSVNLLDTNVDFQWDTIVKIDTSVITSKKCYIEGEMSFRCIGSRNCPETVCVIDVYNFDNIYYKE